MRYEKAVRNCEKPQDVWLLYDVRILGTYSSYEVAKPKLKVAEEESDLNTDTEAKKHRKLKKKRVLSSSEDDEYDQLSSKLKPFPKVKILQTYDHEKNNVERDEITTPSLLQSLTPTASCSSGQDSRSVSSTDTFLSDEDSSKQKNEPDENLTSKQYEEVMKKLPLQKQEGVASVEAMVQAEPEFKSYLILYCSRIGGCKTDEITKLILKKLFSDNVAALYSWLGAKQKRIFSHLTLAEIILYSVRANNKNATDKDITDSIKNWLRHAATRQKNHTHRNLCENNVDANAGDAVHNATDVTII